MRPRIGISTRFILSEETLLSVKRKYRCYICAVEYAGGVPVLIPIDSDFTKLDAVLSQLDGLLLSGGPDLHPHLYGEEPHISVEECNSQLDRLGLALVHWALQNEIPTLGICRGLQLINVALGGTLYQDLGTQYPDSMNHRNPGVLRSHRVYVESNSKIETLLDTREFWVNSRHHQAVKDIGTGIHVAGYAEDGVVELLEVSDHRFMMAAQCHLEEIYSNEMACARLFSTFIEACDVSLVGTF